MKLSNRLRKGLLAQAVLLATTGIASTVQPLEIKKFVVTAQIRTQSLQGVPVSISALRSKEQTSLKLRAAVEVAAQVPNVHTQTPFGDSAPLISMRGMSMSDVTPRHKTESYLSVSADSHSRREAQSAPQTSLIHNAPVIRVGDICGAGSSQDEHEFRSDLNEERGITMQTTPLGINYDPSDTLTLTSTTSASLTLPTPKLLSVSHHLKS